MLDNGNDFAKATTLQDVKIGEYRVWWGCLNEETLRKLITFNYIPTRLENDPEAKWTKKHQIAKLK